MRSKEKLPFKRSLTPREVAVIRKVDAEITRVIADPDDRTSEAPPVPPQSDDEKTLDQP